MARRSAFSVTVMAVACPQTRNPEGVDPEDTRYHLLKLLEGRAEVNQRQLAEAMGVSVGKVHYVLRGLIDKGYVKAFNFKNNKNKRAYLYTLTPSGLSEKLRITRRYLTRRMREYEHIQTEIAALRVELEGTGAES